MRKDKKAFGRFTWMGKRPFRREKWAEDMKKKQGTIKREKELLLKKKKKKESPIRENRRGYKKRNWRWGHLWGKKKGGRARPTQKKITTDSGRRGLYFKRGKIIAPKRGGKKSAKRKGKKKGKITGGGV